ncbi:MAG: hypothetical protein ACNA8N_00920 [Trueperaceae bacterium]
MRPLGAFAFVLLALGLGFGWTARRRWGPLRGVRPWLLALGLAPAHGLAVGIAGVVIGVDRGPLVAFAGATLALVVAAAAAVAWLLRDRPRWSSLVPPAQAVAQGMATALLGGPFAAVGADPPTAGSPAVVAVALVVAAAWWVWLPGRRGRAARAPRTRSGRLRS